MAPKLPQPAHGIRAIQDIAIRDIAVAGAGAAGLAFALGAAEAGFSVILFGSSPTKGDGRTVAMLEGSWRMLERLGVAQRLQAGNHVCPLATMRLVDDTGSLFRIPPVSFRAAEIGLDAFGQNVEVVALVAALAEAVAANGMIRRDACQVTAYDTLGEEVHVHGEAGPIARARLLVGADGRNSAVRAAAGIGTCDWCYPQCAVTTILGHAREHDDISTEFHTRSGPCTLVPLPGRRSSLVWMMSQQEGGRRMALDDAALAREVETQCHSILGKMAIDGPRGIVPMGGLSVSRFSAEGVALVGDAAHAFPPIGAQGLNLGLRDVAGLVEVVAAARDAGRAIGSASTLQAYDAARKPDVRARTGAVDMLNRSLLADLMPVDLGRGLGLLSLGRIGPLRRMVMRQGMGAG